MPGWTFEAWRGVEHLMQPWMRSVAMFATIVLRRTANTVTVAPQVPGVIER
jgi:hypothetical protein